MASLTKPDALGSIAPAAGAVPKPRLVALDAFRGATIALMIVVNNPGGPLSYGPLNHSQWHGWTLTDTVFPTFLWIVGVSITLSLGKRIEAGVPHSRLLAQIFRRAAILFVLGLAIYVFPRFDLSTQRILGVLQRIAICYLIVSVIYLYTGIRGQIAWILSLLAVYWLLMMLVPVPGYGAGRLDLEGNFAHYIDRIVLGRHNYDGSTWDPEGIVSTLPAIVTTLLGIMAGHILRLKTALSGRTLRLLLTGIVLIAAGLVSNIWLPINKKLWTDSFALFMAGLDFVLLAGFLWIIDHLGYQRFIKPLVIMGMNAIALYLASEFGSQILEAVHISSIGERMSIQGWLYSLCLTMSSPINASLLYSIAFTFSMYLIGYLMYRRGWFLRI
jgi:predicted acyltransferase